MLAQKNTRIRLPRYPLAVAWTIYITLMVSWPPSHGVISWLIIEAESIWNHWNTRRRCPRLEITEAMYKNSSITLVWGSGSSHDFKTYINFNMETKQNCFRANCHSFGVSSWLNSILNLIFNTTPKWPFKTRHVWKPTVFEFERSQSWIRFFSVFRASNSWRSIPPKKTGTTTKNHQTNTGWWFYPPGNKAKALLRDY